MSKVRILLPRGYAYQGEVHPNGSVIEFPDEDVHVLLENGFAEVVAEKPAAKKAATLETAEAPPAPENAAKRTRKPVPRKGAK